MPEAVQAMSESSLIELAGSALALCSTIFTGFAVFLMARLTRQSAKSDQQIKSIASTSEKVHKLVNSAMGAQLKLTAVVSRRLATLTKNRADMDAATLAEQLLEDYERKHTPGDSALESDNSDTEEGS